MRTGTKFFIAIVGSILLCAWTTVQTNDIKKAEWLIGTWENKTPKGSIYETWNKTDDRNILGKSYIIKEQDTLIFETIQLIQEHDGLYYIPTVKSQNNGLPVRFSVKTISNTQMVFENTKHDFPQIISYTKITTDSLVAEISGIKNGLERKQIFPMKRMK
ncbi:DUF6265 family protein [Ascidiimonas aurantiaca]|uniref:DUF6265 family protein n=1 Tax=Ascidiimonas aurantiaca TaxID=1685432 RepID=UPI0030ECB2E3